MLNRFEFNDEDPYINWDDEPNITVFQEAILEWQHNVFAAEKKLLELSGLGSVASAVYIAHAYTVGRNCQQNYSKAIHWYSEAERAGWKPASYRKGRILEYQGRTKEAFSEFKKSADLNYLPGVYRTGRALSWGIGVEINDNMSYGYLRTAAKRGHLYAKRMLIGNYFSLRYGFLSFFCGFVELASLLKHLTLIIITDIDAPNNVEKQI